MNLSRDLADHSKSVSDMFSWPETKNDWAKYRLSDEQVNHFKEKGYIANIKLLEEEQVDQLREELLAIMDPKTRIMICCMNFTRMNRRIRIRLFFTRWDIGG